MKCLTLWQPYASAVAYGVKRHETRSWSTPHRGWIAIHASKRDDVGYLHEVDALLAKHGVVEPLPRGAIVCVARLDSIYKTEDVGALIEKADLADYLLGDYSRGRFAWFFSRVLILPKPIAATGAQGLWDWTPPRDVLDLIDADIVLRHAVRRCVR